MLLLLAIILCFYIIAEQSFVRGPRRQVLRPRPTPSTLSEPYAPEARNNRVPK